MKHVAAIALGSNLSSQWGDPAANLNEAARRIGKIGNVRAISSFNRTKPVGFADQPDFTNGALLLETDLEPIQLMRSLLGIERAMGRDRSAAVPPKGPRIIDLDLLLVDSIVLHMPELTLPHPVMQERRFVLEPLAEIAPDLRHPVSGKTAAHMLSELESSPADRN